MRFITKVAIALVASNFLPPEPEAKPRTNFAVRVPPGSAAETAWPNQRSARPLGSFTCSVAYVTDGDTFRCTSGVRVRLSSIDAPEMPGHCQAGRQCTPGDPFAAKATLAGMVAGRTVQCEPVCTTYGRVASCCSVGGSDLSFAMVRSGHAIVRYERRRMVCR